MNHEAYYGGLVSAFGLIIAIGPQNSFVITQGMKRRHAFETWAVCVLCDIVLISVGVLWVGGTVSSDPRIVRIASGLTAGVLVLYGVRSLRSSISVDRTTCAFAGDSSRWSTVKQILMLSLGNPHLYLDTVILLGSISVTYGDTGRSIFGLGAMTASVIWFSTLSVGARVASPVFQSDNGRRVLDGSAGLVLLWSALSSVMVLIGA